MTIIDVANKEHWATYQQLVLEYADSLPFDLDFQGFHAELARIEKMYGPPGGCALLAMAGKVAVGCVGLRRLEEGVCEMKRMFVRPGHRGLGAGGALTSAVLERAAALGYRRMRLDTMESMKSARGLYMAHGFYPIPPYCHNPLAGAVFMEARVPSNGPNRS
ncbi:MAG: GNAT family N-acetyltransferase [Desulfatibacillaceae bacterium]